MAEPHARTEADAGAERRSLIRHAYRLLGSVEDAEDVVQDAHEKLLAAGARPDDPRAYLFRTVTNLAIDRLRHRAVQRRAYPGPWLPEPFGEPFREPQGGPVRGQAGEPASESPGALAIETADDLSMGLMVLLERLSPAERAAFVLREACDLGFDEIGDVLGVRGDACRQRYRRARLKLAGAPRPSASAGVQRQALERLIEAVSTGDAARLAGLLTDDALLVTDGGGRASAAIRPVEDPQRIARVLVHLAARDDHAEMPVRFVAVNGGLGLLLLEPGEAGALRPYACVLVDVADEGVSRIYVVRNPDKLARLHPGSSDRSHRHRASGAMVT